MDIVRIQGHDHATALQYDPPSTASGMPSLRRHSRAEYLDGLRAVAALTVVVQHTLEFSFLGRGGTGVFHALFENWFNFGRYGVAVFFLISGYLIPSSIKEEPYGLRKFLVGRFFRLYPLYWVSLATAVLILPLLREQRFPMWLILENITMLQMLFGGIDSNIIGAYWSLSVELVFYGACVCLLLLGLIHRSATPTYVLIGFGCLMVTASVWDVCFPGVMARLTMKVSTFSMYLQLMFLGQVVRFRKDGREWSFTLAIAMTFLALSIYCLCRQYSGRFEIGLTPLAVFTSTGAAIATFLAGPFLSVLRARVALYLGQISYGIYLFHPLAGAAVRNVIPFAGNLTQTATVVGLVVVMSVMVAALGNVLIEKPFLRMGRHLQKRNSSSRSVAT